MAPNSPLGPNKSLRFDAVQRALVDARHHPKRILEIGCGQGAFASRLAQLGDYIGLEPDQSSFAIAEQRLGRLGRGEVRNVDFEQLKTEPDFDLVCAFEVLEHLVDDRAAVMGWSKVLAPDGLLLISTPADPKRYSPYDKYVGHIRRYEPEVLREILLSAGLSDVRVERYGFPFYNLVEWIYGRLAKIRSRRPQEASAQERTSESGRVFLTPSVLLRLGSGFDRLLHATQRRFPDRGPGLIAYGRCGVAG